MIFNVDFIRDVDDEVIEKSNDEVQENFFNIGIVERFKFVFRSKFKIFNFFYFIRDEIKVVRFINLFLRLLDGEIGLLNSYLFGK